MEGVTGLCQALNVVSPPSTAAAPVFAWCIEVLICLTPRSPAGMDARVIIMKVWNFSGLLRLF